MDTACLFDVYISYGKQMIRAPAIATALFLLFQPLYNMIYKTYIMHYMSDRLFITLLVWLTHIVLYWTINPFFLICDIKGYFKKYKIERQKYQIPTKEQIKKTIKYALFGQLIIEPFGAYFLLFPLFEYFNSPIIYDNYNSNKLYFVLMIDLKFICCFILNAWLFYFAHRLLHHPSLYGIIHKQHHEYKGTISFAAEYAHFVESFLANIFPSLIGAILTGSHPLQYVIWLSWRLVHTYEHHSGYSFYGSWLHKMGLTHAESALFHDFHHTNNIGNYGEFQIDALFQTDKEWNKWFAEWKRKNKDKCC